VLSCLIGGMHRRDIAVRLGIAETTARTHISRILAKLDAHSMIEAAALGRRAGLVAIEP
jgi:DNA-binding NarL/FixJ family response regulator